MSKVEDTSDEEYKANLETEVERLNLENVTLRNQAAQQEPQQKQSFFSGISNFFSNFLL